MKRALLGVAVLALCAGPVAAQQQTFEVKTSTGTYTMSMNIIPGSGDNVAQAAGEKAPEHDGVMMLDVPGDDHVLRTETFDGQGVVTRMVPADRNPGSLMFADTMCTSRWQTRETGAHQFVSTLEQGESIASWAHRHQEGYYVITSVYPPAGHLTDRDPASGVSTRSKVTTVWTDIDGVEHEVTTRQRGNEDKAAWLARHRHVIEVFAEALQPKA